MKVNIDQPHTISINSQDFNLNESASDTEKNLILNDISFDSYEITTDSTDWMFQNKVIETNYVSLTFDSDSHLHSIWITDDINTSLGNYKNLPISDIIKELKYPYQIYVLPNDNLKIYDFKLDDVYIRFNVIDDIVFNWGISLYDYNGSKGCTK